MRSTLKRALSVMVAVVLLSALVTNALAALHLEENFDYGNTAGNLVDVSGGAWVNHSGTTPIGYVPTSLSMSGYGSSGVGGAAVIGSNSEDANLSIGDTYNTGTLYYAALVNVSSAAGGSYFLHFKDSGFNFGGRLFAQDNGGNLRFGLSSSSSTGEYATTDFAYDTTYLTVVKYDLDTGDAALFVLDTYSETEPATPLITTIGSGNEVEAIALRQGSGGPNAAIDGIRVATTWEDAVGVSAPTITKDVIPASGVPYQGVVTYTVVLDNPTDTDEVGALFTDDLPAEVTFGQWIENPGAIEVNNTITWTGILTANSTLTFIFEADHIGAYGDIVTNTAEYSGSVTATAEAIFEVENPFGDITFVYHDLEDVVHAGETVYIAGSFNSWNETATPLTADTGYETFSVTLVGLASDSYEYKYIVNDGGSQWEWLNTNNRSYTVTGDATVDDYRNVTVGWANLDTPAATAADMGTATEDIFGQLYIHNVTNPAGEGRGVKAEVGYGDNVDPAAWDWFPMSFADQLGNNDYFSGVMTPTVPGVFSYTTRFDGNWGMGNPNAGWIYGDLNGIPFMLDQTGVITVNFVADTIAEARAGADGDIFALEGRVTVENDTWGFPEWALQDETGGIAAYFTTDPSVSLGDTVRVIATRGSYQNQEQLGSPTYFEIVDSGEPVAPTPFTTAEVAAGDTEGWLIQLEGVVSGYGGACGNSHNFSLDDGSGAADIRIDYRAGIDFCEMGVENGDTLGVIGFSTQFGTAFQVKPRFPEDILLSYPTISKTAPESVDNGELFTYTLTVENQTGFELTDVVITDVVPANVVFAFADNGGAESAGIVTWNFASLAHGATLTANFAVTATGNVGDVLANEDYAVAATNYVTPTFGRPVYTGIGDYIPTYVIQGDGETSPYNGLDVTTVGVVIGFFEMNFPDYDGFYLQDTTGDGDTTTSDAVFVIYDKGNNPGVSIGDQVTVTGMVQEFSEYGYENCVNYECQTNIELDTVTVAEAGIGGITPVELDPPGDPAEAKVYWESLEGMLVTYPDTLTVVGPTSYGAVFVVDSELGVERVMRTGPYAGMVVSLRNWEYYGRFDGADAPNLIVGSEVTNAVGPLGQTRGNYMIFTQADNEWEVVSEAPEPSPLPFWPAPEGDSFTAATFNTLNFDETGGSKMDKVVATIVDQLNCPTFLSLQELEMDNTLPALKTALAAEGCPYDSFNSHEDVGNHGVAVLWRTDQVQDIVTSDAYQSCSPYGSSSSTYDPIWATCQAEGEYPLFSRRPVVVTATHTASDQTIVVLGNHFKSKIGGFEADIRRLGQGEFVADLADMFLQDTPYVLILGDLNEFEDYPPINAIYASGSMTNTWYSLPAEERYSYNFNGVSQILDHIITSNALRGVMSAMSPLHLNSDFPNRRYATDGSTPLGTSDHDLVIATFNMSMASLELTKDVEAPDKVYSGDIVTYTITLSNIGVPTVTNVMLEDVLPSTVEFVAFEDNAAGAVEADNVITWSGDIDAGEEVIIIFTVRLRPNNNSIVIPVVNTATFTSDNAGSGSAQASFDLYVMQHIFLPVVINNFDMTP